MVVARQRNDTYLLGRDSTPNVTAIVVCAHATRNGWPLQHGFSWKRPYSKRTRSHTQKTRGCGSGLRLSYVSHTIWVGALTHEHYGSKAVDCYS